MTAAELERLIRDVSAPLASSLGVTVPTLTVRLHGSIDGFRLATGQPWWMGAVVRGSDIDLAPAAVLELRESFERVVTRAVAEALMAPSLDRRPAWVRVGGARYFAQGPVQAADARVRCPADAELMAAVSASAQREAEVRAETCFARAMGRGGDWREIR